MILTKVLTHKWDLSKELEQAKKVAEFAISNRDKLTSKWVKTIGLKSAISNQILKKYGRNTKCKEVTNVNLIVPAQNLKITDLILKIIPLKLEVDLSYLPPFEKINQVEISATTIFISYTVKEDELKTVTEYVGVDLNATGHILVAANPATGLVLKMGKLANHFRRKYRGRKKCGNFMRDLDHKLSRGIVNYCLKNNCGIALERLKGIRPKKGKGKKLNGLLHSWSFFRLQTFIQYKAKLAGVPVVFVDPSYTSQACSRCGEIGNRKEKTFKCSCGHVDHADANAAFNIGRLAADRDVVKRCTDTPSLEPLTL